MYCENVARGETGIGEDLSRLSRSSFYLTKPKSEIK